ncbi:hypothetical protein AYO49_02135 [Verrucomicrobiaceae bacterium SCGC AG-212-N21]|nr:hypothetical protein AYO49_02135 [Verrucomicrobiaceae bacterium SCGC AG-212-N21]
MQDLVFDPVPDWPTWIVAASLSFGLLAWLAWRNTARLGVRPALFFALLRMSAVAVLLLLLLRPQRRESLPIERREAILIAGIDVSESMNEADVGSTRRLDAALRLVQNSKLDDPRLQLRFTSFDENARAVPPAQVAELKAEGRDSRFHTSILTMLQQAPRRKSADQSLILFTDGHDFEMVSPTRTALAARAQGVVIHAVPFGAFGQVRDAAVRMAGYQPYCYVKQKCRISAVVRLSGCENDFLTAQLLRDGKAVESKTIPTRTETEIPLDFTITEAEAGQVEYEIRVAPLYREAEVTNNSAITYVNVLDDKIRVLLLEGSPYWDTTFLQRTLLRNDKMDLDALVQVQPGKLRRIRKSEASGALDAPATAEDFAAYDVVLLGAKVSDLLNQKSQAALVDYVRESAGVVVSLRGPTGLQESAAAILEPVQWEAVSPQQGELQASREGRVAGPLGLLSAFAQDGRRLPALTSAFVAKERRELAATLAETRPADSQLQPLPALIHRPVGRGQSLALGAGDWWRWAMSSEVAASEAVFDRFWDNLIVWLMAGSDRVPGAQTRLGASTGNLPLGEAMHFRLQLRQGAAAIAPPEIELRCGNEVTERLTMRPTSAPLRFEASTVPQRPGRYQATVALSDGTTQTVRFMVFQEHRERTEVSTDRAYLKTLCDGTGGQVIEPAQFPKFVQALASSVDSSGERFRKVPLWDRPWLLFLIVTLLAIEWYARRRRGLS